MSTDPSTDHAAGRIQGVLSDAVARLSPSERAERIAWCREHDQHGVVMTTDDADDLLEFSWGGQPLAVVHRNVFAGDGPIRAEFIGPVPDSPESINHGL